MLLCMSNRIAPLVGLVVACLVSSVAAEAVAQVSYGWGRVLGFQPNLAGRDLNGVGLNGEVLEGRQLAYVLFDDVTVDGASAREVWLDGSRFDGRAANGRRLRKLDDFVGATFTAVLDDEGELPLYVAGVERHPEPGRADVHAYEVWFATHDGWEPLCGEDDDGLPLLAIPLEGRWNLEEGVAGGGSFIDDPSAFTFACDGYVLAKCVLGGYEPWQRALSCTRGEGCRMTTLADHHQACTRALRADYLGDGSAHTHDGAELNLFDGFGVRQDSESWQLEALWAPEGALCLDVGRTPGDDITWTGLPSCSAQPLVSGALLVSEVPASL